MESSHVTYNPELHWRLAAKWNNYRFEDFILLDGELQSRAVAAYESALQMEAVTTLDAQRMASRKNNRRRGHG